MLQNKYKCTLNIKYEVIVTAPDEKEAENDVFDKMADSITEGLIPIELYEPADACCPMPLLMNVDVSLQ